MDGNWKTLPLVNFGKKNYNNDAGNNAGEPQQEGVGECTDAEILELNKLAKKLNSKHRLQISLLLRFLAVSSDEQQKRQYLDQLLIENSAD